jgi:hypothetical protein
MQMMQKLFEQLGVDIDKHLELLSSFDLTNVSVELLEKIPLIPGVDSGWEP